MKVRAIKEVKEGKHTRPVGFTKVVTNDHGKELIASGKWEEVDVNSFDEKMPRSKSNPKPVVEEKEEE